MFARPRNSANLPLINSTDPSFELELHRRRAFSVHLDPQVGHGPDDLKVVENGLSARRASPEPDEHHLASFQRRLRNSCNEAAVVQGVMPRLVPIDRLLDREDVLTVPNQQWDKECGLPIPSSAQYRIPPPKPDQTIGLSATNFGKYETALACLSHAARPIRLLPNLTFPLVTVEAKGDKGHNVCRSQNLHNAAVMLHQLLRLWEDTGRGEDFYGQVMVCTISITTQTCAISHHWMESGPNGPSVHGRLSKSWTLSLKESLHLNVIVRSIRNTIDFAIKRGMQLIVERLACLEANLTSLSTPSTTSTSSSGSPGSRKRRFIVVDEAYGDEYSSSVEDEDSPIRKATRTKYSSRRRIRQPQFSSSRRTSSSSVP